jgi:hypothetical protein
MMEVGGTSGRGKAGRRFRRHGQREWSWQHKFEREWCSPSKRPSTLSWLPSLLSGSTAASDDRFPECVKAKADLADFQKRAKNILTCSGAGHDPDGGMVS